jgi:hypothetical protein
MPLVVNSIRKTPLGRSLFRGKNNIKMYLKRKGWKIVDSTLPAPSSSIAFTLYAVVVGTPLHSPLPLSVGRQRTPVVGVHEFCVGKVKWYGREGTSSLGR